MCHKTLHSTKLRVWLYAGSNPARGGSWIHDGESLWQEFRLKISLKPFVGQPCHFIMSIHSFIHPHHHQRTCPFDINKWMAASQNSVITTYFAKKCTHYIFWYSDHKRFWKTKFYQMKETSILRLKCNHFYNRTTYASHCKLWASGAIVLGV